MTLKTKNTALQAAQEKLKFGVIFCLTLELAPFFPEPHLFGKLRWVLGGAKGMSLMDWLDLLMHGAPWLFLVYAIMGYFKVKNQQK